MKDYSVLDGMRKQTSEIIMQAFDKGYKQGYNDAMGEKTKLYDEHDVKNIKEESYQDGYGDGYKRGKDEAYKNPVPTQDAYQKGLDDAWSAARKIVCGDYDSRVFEDSTMQYILENYSASGAITLIKEYEEKQNNRCSFCIHCEMCGWIEAHKNCGCDCFDDGKMQEDKE